MKQSTLRTWDESKIDANIIFTVPYCVMQVQTAHTTSRPIALWTRSADAELPEIVNKKVSHINALTDSHLLKLNNFLYNMLQHLIHAVASFNVSYLYCLCLRDRIGITVSIFQPLIWRFDLAPSVMFLP